jgi:hypothetical protein
MRAVALTERHHEGPAMTRCFLVFLISHPLSWAFVVGLAGFAYVGVTQTVPATYRDRATLAIASGIVGIAAICCMVLQAPG